MAGTSEQLTGQQSQAGSQDRPERSRNGTLGVSWHAEKLLTRAYPSLPTSQSASQASCEAKGLYRTSEFLGPGVFVLIVVRVAG